MENEILTENERNYIRGIIQPYIGKYKIGVRRTTDFEDGFVQIEILNADRVIVCFICTDNMRFWGMTDDRQYSLGELGIDEG